MYILNLISVICHSCKGNVAKCYLLMAKYVVHHTAVIYRANLAVPAAGGEMAAYRFMPSFSRRKRAV